MDFNERIDFFPALFKGNPDGHLDLMLQNTFLDHFLQIKIFRTG